MAQNTWYDKEFDILGAHFSKEKSWKSLELPNGVVLDLSKSGKIVGLEIFKASRFFKKEDLENILSLVEAEPSSKR